MKWQRIFIILLFGLSTCVSKVKADSNFDTAIQTTYTIDLDGEAKVRHEVILTNQTSAEYAQEFSFVIGSLRAEDIEAFGPGLTQIPYRVDQNQGRTSITLTFPDQVVGRGKKRVFNLEYKDLDVSQRSGNVVEITIPQTEAALKANSQSILVHVPKALGNLSLLEPKNGSVETDEAFTHIRFDNLQSLKRGITMLFGDKQLYQFTLRYNLENDSITPILTQVALPPDTDYQRVMLEQMEPKPQSLLTDPDGNWIATYEIKAKSQVIAIVKGYITTWVKPIPIPREPYDLNAYLQPQPYWEVNDKTIEKIAATHSTPQEIYDYVVSSLTYNFDRIDTSSTARLGAKQVLNQPQNALCMEFSDAFIAIARKAGIPARLVTGHAITQNNRLRPLGLLQDVLHAWPEYYDASQNRFIPIDPTWGNTTGGVDYFKSLDFNHIVFAIQGLNSEKPYPAGLYKFNQQNSKDIHIEVVNQIPTSAMMLDFDLNMPLITRIGWQKQLELKITNHSGLAIYDLSPQLNTDKGQVLTYHQLQPLTLLPFQTGQLKLEFDQWRIPGDNIAVKLYDTNKQIHLQRFIWLGTLLAGGFATLVAFGLFVFAKKAWRVLVSRRS